MKRLLKHLLGCVLLFSSLQCIPTGISWSNGGYSDDPSKPDYGTHDWITDHAVDWLPSNIRELIDEYMNETLFGTELPDNSGPDLGIGDTVNHVFYYYSNGTIQRDKPADRAEEVFQRALMFLAVGDMENAAIFAGIMSHYIADVSAFGHVMGAVTVWGDETRRIHSKYEEEVNDFTGSYESELNSYLVFDGSWETVSAYEATCRLAYDTTFGDGVHDCLWMNRTMNFDDPEFMDRVGESLNLAVNYVTDVLYTLYSHFSPTTCDFIVRVMDANEGPIQGAVVRSTVQPVGQETLLGYTDVDGEILFENIVNGEYNISVSKDGYETESDRFFMEGEESITALFILIKGNELDYNWVIIVFGSGSLIAFMLKKR